MSNLSTAGINYFTLGVFHRMLFDILNNYSYNMFGLSYNNLDALEKFRVWEQVRMIFDSRVELIGEEPFSGFKMIEEDE